MAGKARAQVVPLLFGIVVSPMAVWRSVQRLGEAREQYTEHQARLCSDGRHEAFTTKPAPGAAGLSVDGCALSMQVRDKRRRRKDGERLPPLPAVDEGHFREVKTGALLLPEERGDTTRACARGVQPAAVAAH